MFSVTTSGDSKRTMQWLDRLRRGDIYSDLNRYGQMGVEALRRATPVESSLTANSWDYRIVKDRHTTTIEWFNTNMAGGTSVAILLQYGHGTGTGGFVAGRDYINPAMRPVFDRIAAEVWKRVIS